MKALFDLSGRVALVTGGAGGIGAVITEGCCTTAPKSILQAENWSPYDIPLKNYQNSVNVLPYRAT